MRPRKPALPKTSPARTFAPMVTPKAPKLGHPIRNLKQYAHPPKAK
jgi:hypothetical protein